MSNVKHFTHTELKYITAQICITLTAIYNVHALTSTKVFNENRLQ